MMQTHVAFQTSHLNKSFRTVFANISLIVRMYSCMNFKSSFPEKPLLARLTFKRLRVAVSHHV